VKNTCIWITIDDSPAGIASCMPRNSELEGTDREPVRGDHRERHPRAGNEEHEWHGGEGKAQRREREGRGLGRP
jgi:hypothetical protein